MLNIDQPWSCDILETIQDIQGSEIIALVSVCRLKPCRLPNRKFLSDNQIIS